MKGGLWWSAFVPFEEQWRSLHLSLNSNHLATICDRMSLMFRSTGVTLGQNLGRKGLTDISQILVQSWRDMGLSVSVSSAI